MAQTWSAFEIVIVDDCSTDSSWSHLQSLARAHPSIRTVRHEHNRGYPAALNTLVSEAQGEFVAFFDDDDESVPERLAEQIRRITTYEALSGSRLVLCYSNRNIVKIGESEVFHVSRAIGHSPPEPYGSVVADYILGVPRNNSFCWGAGLLGSCTMMARRSAFAAVGPYDVAFRRAAEMDFAIRAAFAGAHFVSVDTPLVTQYKTKGSDKSVEVNFRYWLKLRSKYRAYLRSQRAYWGALALLRMNTQEGRGHHIRAWAWALAAFISLPLRLSMPKLLRRVTSSRFFRRDVGRE
jgi:glycosyltransferase involved in cell wall biosynthesis